MNEVEQIASDYAPSKSTERLPIIVAGDLFHEPDPPVSFVNAMVDVMPKVWAVPGNHDLPNHDISQIEKTAFWTLCRLGMVRQLKPTECRTNGDFGFQGFGCGQKVKQDLYFDRPKFKVAVIHDYLWGHESQSYPNAPLNKRHTYWATILKREGFDVGVFGDNHVHMYFGQPMLMFNAGCLLNRNCDLADTNNYVGILYDDMSFKTIQLDRYDEKWKSKEKFEPAAEEKYKLFIEGLRRLGGNVANFCDELARAIKENADKLSPEVQAILWDIQRKSLK